MSFKSVVLVSEKIQIKLILMHKAFTSVYLTLAVLLASIENMTSSKGASSFENISVSCGTFSGAFYKSLSSLEGNKVCSPLSLHVILSLLSQGTDGETLEQLKKVLQFQDDATIGLETKSLIAALHDVADVELSLANAMYIQKDLTLMTDFLSVSTDVFHCSISMVNFHNAVHAANEINSWIRDATKNKISDVVSSDDFCEDTKMILVNAIYFKAPWMRKFDTRLTENREFYIAKTETKLVPMMFMKSKFMYGDVPTMHARFLEIPYANQDITMIIILPNEVDGLQFLEENFNWKTVMKARRTEEKVELHLPRFKVETTLDLEDKLRKTGLTLIFEDNADFSRLSNTPLKVSSVVQKAFVEVNEEGSEAAAATVAQMRLRRMIDSPAEFLVDRPFMFAIHHKPSCTPLILGSVRDIQAPPTKDEL